ncbi:MAG: hypothetical protein R3E09_05890 [Novosphingobium sp.]
MIETDQNICRSVTAEEVGHYDEHGWACLVIVNPSDARFPVIG